MKFYRPERVWINQPSTLQEFHDLHGKVGIAVPEKGDDDFITIYFCDGPIISQRIRKNVLAPA